VEKRDLTAEAAEIDAVWTSRAGQADAPVAAYTSFDNQVAHGVTHESRWRGQPEPAHSRGAVGLDGLAADVEDSR
jgi:hypothetical protein